jgi:hypothetical protein
MKISQKTKFFFLVHLKQNGNGISYPVRPYRSKDYLIASEPSTLYRYNPPFKSLYSTDDEIIPNRRSILKETDLDNVHHLSNGTIKTLPINRNRTIFSSNDSSNESNHGPITIQRRSSFQAATQLNSLDFYTTSDPFYFLDKQLIKPTQRNHYSPESDLREREHYREKRRNHSPYPKINLNRQSSLIVENHMLTNGYSDTTNSTNDQQSHEINSTNESSYKDDKNFILNNDGRNDDYYRNDGIFV